MPDQPVKSVPPAAAPVAALWQALRGMDERQTPGLRLQHLNEAVLDRLPLPAGGATLHRVECRALHHQRNAVRPAGTGPAAVASVLRSPHREDADPHCLHFQNSYTDAGDLGHILHANMGILANAYRLAAGFKQLEGREGVALAESLEPIGARGGFGDALLRHAAGAAHTHSPGTP